MISFIHFTGFVLASVQAFTIMDQGTSMPGPFTRVLEVGMSGKDVVILNNLLQRVPDGSHKPTITSVYDEDTKRAVEDFQQLHNLKVSGILNKETAELVLRFHISDGYKGDEELGDYKFKFLIPVHRDRNIETMGTLFDGNGAVVYRFKVRAHGALDSNGHAINQLTTNGNTPTGLMTADLNSKEPSAKLFGPYPVIRCVKGLKGNAAIGVNDNTLLSNYRSGILIHTGEWDNWNPEKDMPNSKGCMHVHPTDMKNIVDLLTNQLDVVVNDNPFGKLPYPYKTQGYVSIVQID